MSQTLRTPEVWSGWDGRTSLLSPSAGPRVGSRLQGSSRALQRLLMWILFSFHEIGSGTKEENTKPFMVLGRKVMPSSCGQLAQKIVPFRACFACRGVLSSSLKSLDYFNNEEAGRGIALLFKSSETKFPTVSFGPNCLMRKKYNCKGKQRKRQCY